MRGKICVDGTFWSISDATTSKDKHSHEKQREITITIEKHFVPTSSVGGTQTYDQLTDFDWGGIYPNDEDEVTHRKYDEAEELNVKEYAARLGVDIDNLDMNKVDKSMFGAGLGDNTAETTSGLGADGDTTGEQSDGKGFRFNITQATLEQLSNAGLAKEIVQQGDGMEYELEKLVDGNEMNKQAFSMLGKDISQEELREAGIIAGSIPEMWRESVPLEDLPEYRQSDEFGVNKVVDGIMQDEIIEMEVNVAGDGDAESELISACDEDEALGSLAEGENEENEEEDQAPYEVVKDPIDKLTVSRLKEVLRQEGLKVSGNKQELRDRLREHVSVLLQEE